MLKRYLAARGTPAHLVDSCWLHADSRREAFGAVAGTFTDLVSKPSLTALVTKWVIRSGELPQFELAGRLLYQDTTPPDRRLLGGVAEEGENEGIG